MRILLINPPVPQSYYNREFYIPSSLVYLAAVLRDRGHEIRILDLRIFDVSGQGGAEAFYDQRVAGEVSSFGPDLIGFGCLFSGNFPDVLRLSQVCKRYCPDVPIVSGGIHFTIHARDILTHCPSIDWIILAEGEESILRLVEAMGRGRRGLERIDGFGYRDRGQIKIHPKASYIEDIDRIPFPAYDLVRIEDYAVDTSGWHNPKGLSFQTSIPIISSRSCPNRCTFCSMYMTMGPRWRARSARNVVDEIEHVVQTYGQNHFSFMDDNFTFCKARTLEICDEIVRRGLDIQFETPNGLSLKTLDEEVMDALDRAGLVRVSLAVESGSDFIRNQVMKKHLSREKILEVVGLTRKYPNLYVKAFFIIGMPEETLETLEETYRMIEQIDVDRIYLQNIVPFPGTRVFEQSLRDHLLVDVDVDSLYRSDALYITNYDRLFIKPYALELDQLREFRQRCDALIRRQTERRRRPIQALGKAGRPSREVLPCRPS
jgi:anaerobic magnesium-protoporphyrin IX monomethyl ester cyclase